MAVHHGYVGAKSCTSGPQPGARGAMAWFLAKYASQGGLNTGIYNCRSVRGGRTTSLHGEGRAADFGIRPYSAKYGSQLAEAMRRKSKELGIQCIIWDRKIWSGAHPSAGWRRYTGVAHHKDHIHVEFTWATARKSANAVVNLFNKHIGDVGNIKVGGGGGSPSYTTVTGSTPLVKLYHKGEPVKRIQKAVGITVDGYYGPNTKNAVQAYQRKHGLAADGIVGPKTWAAINGGKPKPAPKPKTPAFPLPSGHWYGVESSNPKNHSGYYAKDRAGIRQLQQGLKDRNWKISVDGRYGPATRRIVTSFQRKAGIRVDGAVGAQTWAAIFNKPLMKR